MGYTKVYFEDTTYGSGSWTEEPNIIKIITRDTMNSPFYMEFLVADPDHTAQNNETYQAYRRVKVVEFNTGEVVFLGRVEYVESSNDDTYGPVLRLCCRDMLQEYDTRNVDHDFSGRYTTCGGLIAAICKYYTYTEITYKSNSGTFVAGRWVKTGTSQARIANNDTTTKTLSLTDVIDDSSSFTNNASLVEYTNEACTTASGVSALQDGALRRNIDTSLISSSVAMDSAQGDFSHVNDAVIKVLDQISVQQAKYDFMLNFGTSPANYPPQFVWFSRGSLYSSPATTGMILELNPASPNAYTKAYRHDYAFPIPEREQLSQIVVKSLDEDGNAIQGEAFNGAVAFGNKVNAKRITQRLDISNETTLQTIASNIASRTGSMVQRGKVTLEGYPYFNRGSNVILRAGHCVRVKNSRLSTVNNTDMIVTKVEYEEPPGIATITLCSTTTGISHQENTWPTSTASMTDEAMVINSPDSLSIYKLAMAPGYLPIVMKIGLTSTAYNGVAWTGGVIKCSDGSEFTVVAGSLTLANTSPYYLYYDTSVDDGNVSSTQVFTDTTSNERLLLAFLKQGPDSTRDAMIVPARGEDTLLPTIAASQIYTTDLSAINADLGLITAGEIRLGTGTVGVNFTGWRLWLEGSPGSEIGKIGGFSSGTPQWYSDTDGRLYAGGGNVKLDALGATFNDSAVTFTGTWYGITTIHGLIQCTSAVTSGSLWFVMPNNTSAYFQSTGKFQILSGSTSHLDLQGYATTISANKSVSETNGWLKLGASSTISCVSNAFIVEAISGTAQIIASSTIRLESGGALQLVCTGGIYPSTSITPGVAGLTLGTSTAYWLESNAGKYTAITGGFYCKSLVSSDTTAYSGYAVIYSKDVGGVAKLFARDGSGAITQLTP